LSIRIDELENKRQFKCTWVNCKLKEEVSLLLIYHSSVLILYTLSFFAATVTVVSV